MPKAPHPSVPGLGGVPSADRSCLRSRGSPPKFTIPGPFGHEIGQLADAVTRQTRDCSPDAMGVVPTRGRDTPIAISARRSRGSPDQGCRHGGRRGRETHRRPHISAMLQMLREPGSAHYGTTDRPRTPAPVRDTTRPTRARARSVALGRSVMKRTCIKRPRTRSERPGLRHSRRTRETRISSGPSTRADRAIPTSTRPGSSIRRRGVVMANEGLDLFADAFVPGAPSLAQRPAVGRGYVRWPGDRLRRRRGGARGHYGAGGAGGVWLDTRWFVAGCDPRRRLLPRHPGRRAGLRRR